MEFSSKLVLFASLICFKIALVRSSAFDVELYKNVLDPEECIRQLEYIRENDTLLSMQFMDASWRIPRSLLQGNTHDFGNYFQCLDISKDVDHMDMRIRGKYCPVQFSISAGTPQYLPRMGSSKGHLINVDENVMTKSRTYENFLHIVREATQTEPHERTEIGGMPNIAFELAMCVPKVCTTREALNFFTNNMTETMTMRERFCRLPNDKPWVAADTVAVVLLSFIGLLTILSTAYDIRHTIFQEKGPKEANQFYQSLSIFTNTRSLFNFPSGPSVITCLDGIRSFAMLWVIVGHTFLIQGTFGHQNLSDVMDFVTGFWSLWVTSATITVDTFFMISGLLVVYISASKMTRWSLIKNLHFFYLNRFLRMFPVLAFTILLSASFLHKMADGPYFRGVVSFTENCRKNWWVNLLYVHNFVRNEEICLPHTWYLALDMQFFFFSPLVLFWVLGQRKRIVFLGLSITFVGFIAGASVYNFINNFQSSFIPLSRFGDITRYMLRYYYHPLPRVAPFIVGMIYGYIFHIYRTTRPKIPVFVALFLWLLSMGCIFGVVVSTYWNIQPDWDNQLVDNILNSYKRPIWAASVGWLAFACHNGYGGPVNWVLSLDMFRMLGRLSYAMYLLHYPLMYLLAGTNLTRPYFTINSTLDQFLVDFTITLFSAFLVTIFIDIPFSNLVSLGMGRLKKRKSHTKKQYQGEENPGIKNLEHNDDTISPRETDSENKLKV